MFEFYLLNEYYFASAQLIFAMLGMGATLRFADFVEVLKFPRGFILGLTCVLLLSPLVALTVSRLFSLEPGITTGLILVAAVPGGTMSNILTYFARGNVPLSISLTGTATVGCLVSTPLVLRLFAPLQQEGELAMPVTRISLEIVFFLLIPLFAGMVAGTRLEGLREKFAQLCIRASLAVIFVMVVGSAGAGRVDAGAHGPLVILALFVYGFTLLVLSLGAARLLGLASPDTVAIGIEAAYRNISLALLVKASLFPAIPGVPDPFADQVFFVALLYGGFAMLIVLPPLFLHRRKTAG